MRESDRILLAEISRWETLREKRDADLADLIGMSYRTFCRKKKMPGEFSLGDIRNILRVTKADEKVILGVMR